LAKLARLTTEKTGKRNVGVVGVGVGVVGVAVSVVVAFAVAEVSFFLSFQEIF
jgi:hypothetical protein